MDFNLIKKEGYDSIAHIISKEVVFNDAQEALELTMNINYYNQDVRSFIIEEHNLPAAFFDLKTGVAGDILQKFSNYQFKLAIICDLNKYKSKSLSDFIRESNRIGRVIFVDSEDAAILKFHH